MDELLKNEKVLVAVIAAVSAIIGAVLASVIAPWVKSAGEERKIKLELQAKEAERKRAQIEKWRKMVLEVQEKIEFENDAGQLLQLHPDYMSLEALLSDSARVGVYGDNRMITVGSAFSTPLLAIKDDIARIEKEWGLA